MPELPEVETVCRGLAKPLVGAKIVKATPHRADLRTPIPPNLNSILQGRKIFAIHRRAKYILVDVEGGKTLVLHLGMSGRMTLSRENTPLEKHDHISFDFSNGWFARFNDPRRFGLCTVVETAHLPDHKLMRGLGVEPLDETFNGAQLLKIFYGLKSPIKLALLDQKRVVGIGNIYASEALFASGIHPERAAGSLAVAEAKNLVAAIKTVLRAAIAAGGSSLRDYVHADGELGYFQHQFAVYDREGQPCKNCTCTVKKSGGVQRITQGGRSTFFCAKKQKAQTGRN